MSSLCVFLETFTGLSLIFCNCSWSEAIYEVNLYYSIKVLARSNHNLILEVPILVNHMNCYTSEVPREGLDQQLLVISVLGYGNTIDPQMGILTAFHHFSQNRDTWILRGIPDLDGYKDRWNWHFPRNLLLSFLSVAFQVLPLSP